MILVEDLTRRFGAVTAVEGLSFRLERGEVVGFLGPNGSGKTTVMRILSGFLPATSGHVEVAGLDVLRHSLAVRRRIGYLPESVPLYREHRVVEMLAFQGRLHGLPRREWKRRIPAVLDLVGMRPQARSLIGHLSRGQRQRVGIALALLPEPQVLILDEPTSGLDPLQRMEMRGLLRSLAAEHTVLLSSHILPEIEAVCPRVIILSRGHIAADGAPQELVRHLGGQSHVRFEALVGADVAAALRALSTVRGLGSVIDLGRVGIHHAFRLACEEDLREEIGAIAALKGWAVRELSWHRPSLEEIFARIALELEAPGDGPAPQASAPSSAAPPPTVQGLDLLPPPPAPGRVVYNLNPFDQGATRDLSRPKPVERPGPPEPGPSECEAGA